MNKFKRLLVLSFSALLGFGIVACDNPTPSVEPSSEPADTSSEPTDTSTPVDTSTDDTSTPDVDVTNYAADIAILLKESYKDDVNLKMADFTLPTKQKTFDDNDNQIIVDVAWTITVNEGGVEGAVVMGEVNDNDQIPVTILYNADVSVKETTFVLKCEVTDPNGNKASFEVNCAVPAFEFASYEDFKAAVGTDTVVNVVGHVVAVYKSGVYLVDDEGYGFYAYSPTFEGTMDQNTLLAAYPIGSKVLASGTATVYNGQHEFNKGCAVKVIEEAADDFEIPYKDATDLFVAAEGTGDKSLDDLVNSVVSIEGVTIEESDLTNYYYYFSIDGVKFYLRTSGSYNDFTNDYVNTFVAEWTQGYKANLKGLVGIYSGKYYITPIEADAVTITERTLSDAVKVDVAIGNAEREFGVKFEEATEIELPATDENGVELTYEVLSGTGIAINEGKLVVTPGASEETCKLKVTATINDETETVEIDVVVASALPVVTPIADALAAADGTSVYVLGTVKSAEPWSTQYNNMSITITDGTNDLYIFRTNTQVEVGQTVLVKGTMATYKDSRQIAQGSTADILAYKGTTTLDAAVALEDGTDVVVVGTVKEADTWSTQYNNMSVTIVDALGNELYVYRLSTQVNVGDVIVVTGKMGSYKGAKQIAQGATATDVETYLASIAVPPTIEVTANANVNAYTADDGAVTLGDLTVVVDADGKVIFASYTAPGYGGPGDGFYHDGTYAAVAGQQCGIFNLDAEWAGWPNTTADGRNAWTLYTVQAPEGATIYTGAVADMLPVVNEIFELELTEMVDNAVLENSVADGSIKNPVEITVEEPVNPNAVLASYTGGTTNMTDDAAANATLLGLDSTWTVTSTARGDLHVGLNKAGDIRLYGTSGGNPGNTLTFTHTGANIATVSFELVSGSNTNFAVYVNDVAVEAVDGVYTINAASFTIKNMNENSTQVKFTAINMVLAEEAAA